MKDLRGFTMARVGVGRAGNSLPTRELLDFQLAHARARDAVHFAIDARLLRNELEAARWDVVTVRSAACDRSSYLRRPDLGRRLDAASLTQLEGKRDAFDVVFVIADGLSAPGVHRYAVELVGLARQRLDGSMKIAPLVIAEQARVALSDEIGAVLNAALAVILIGERPGLSSADSLGAYLTWAPHPGRTDAERNCISNIRTEGTSPKAAAQLLIMLIEAARTRQVSGVTLSADLAAGRLA